MFLGRHTCLSWLLAGPGFDCAPILSDLGGAPPWVLTVGDRRRVARVVFHLDVAIDLSGWCERAFGDRAAGRVDVCVGRTGSVPVMAVESQMGGPATEIVLREILDPMFHPGGVRAVIRVGSCGVLPVGDETPDLVVADFARAGLSGEALPCSRSVTEALLGAAPAAVRSGVLSENSLYAEGEADFPDRMRDSGCAATEMELATIGPIAEAAGAPWGGVMAAAGRVDTGEWYDGDEVEHNEDRAIRAALRAVRDLAEGAEP